MSKELKTFSQGIKKTDFIKEIKWHMEQDKIIKGTYGKGRQDNWRGCAVGCSIHSINKLANKDLPTDDHSVYETELGIPEWLAYLEDAIFEGLPESKAKEWPLRFTKAIKVGVNLEPVKWKFSAFLLSENIERVLSLDIEEGLKKQVVDAVREVLDVAENAIKTGVWDESAARSAESTARSAQFAARFAAWATARSAESTARSAQFAARFAAWAAAESTARAAARSAESTAWAAQFAARFAARAAARSAESTAWAARVAAESTTPMMAYERYADKLIELIKEIK